MLPIRILTTLRNLNLDDLMVPVLNPLWLPRVNQPLIKLNKSCEILPDVSSSRSANKFELAVLVKVATPEVVSSLTGRLP